MAHTELTAADAIALLREDSAKIAEYAAKLLEGYASVWRCDRCEAITHITILDHYFDRDDNVCEACFKEENDDGP